MLLVLLVLTQLSQDQLDLQDRLVLHPPCLVLQVRKVLQDLLVLLELHLQSQDPQDQLEP